MDERFKILVISDYRNTNSVRPEANIFMGLAARGHDITIMTYPGTTYLNDFQEAGIRVIESHPTKRLSKTEISFIRKELKSGSYDFLHLFNSTAITNGVWAAQGLPVKVISYRGYPENIHWYDPIQYFKFLHPRIDAIVCNAQNVADWFTKQLFFKKKKAVVINKGHLVEWFDHIGSANLSELGIIQNLHPEPDLGSQSTHHEPFVISVVANDRPVKGVHVLLKAVALLPSNANIHFLLIGDRIDSKRNLNIIKHYKHRNRIHFLGFQKNPLPWVKASHAMVMPSIGGESLTKTIIEAASLGVAPLLSDLPGNKQLFVHEESCLKFPPNNSAAISETILRVYENRQFCSAIGANARKFIDKHLNIKDSIDGYELMYGNFK